VSLAEQLDNDLKAALRSGDERTKSMLRLVRAGVKNAEVAKGPGTVLDDAGILNVIAKEIREHKDSLAEFLKANRNDLAEVAVAELVILQRYMPVQLSRDEIEVAAKAIIASVGATGLGDKNKVMPVIMTQLRGKADGRDINEVVSALLAGG